MQKRDDENTSMNIFQWNQLYAELKREFDDWVKVISVACTSHQVNEMEKEKERQFKHALTDVTMLNGKLDNQCQCLLS